MRSLLALLVAAKLLATEVEIGPKNNTVAEEVHEIAMLMHVVSSALRDDRHDRTVQMDSEEVIERIEKLIKDCEEIEKHPQDFGRRIPLLRMKGAMPDSKLPQVRILEGETKAATNGESDATLRRVRRDEAAQVWPIELPLKWRQRIAAYFLSVNAAESEKRR